MKGKARTSGALLIAALILIVSPVSAFAHSAIISSDPEANATLSIFPTTLTVTFNEALLTLGGSSSNFLELRSPSGELIELSESRVEDRKLIADVIPIDAPSGRFTITYRAVSSDGHVIKGEIGFIYESPMTETPETATEVITKVNSEASVPEAVLVGFILAASLLALLIYLRAGRENLD